MLMIIIVICGSFVETCINPEDHVKIPSNDRQYILERLVTEGMPSIDASNSIIELGNFYTAVNLNTPMYFEFTDKVFGRSIHHALYWSGNKEKDSSNAYFDLIGLGLKNLNTIIWFGESAGPSIFDPMIPFPLPNSGCRTVCIRS